MASIGTPLIGFSFKNGIFVIDDLVSDNPFKNIDMQNSICEVSVPYAKFINCKYAEIRSSGSVSLESCTVGKVNAAGMRSFVIRRLQM